jgi:hydrogenase-1 operon protein HyaF
MKPFPLPVTGPGSQSQGDDDLHVLSIPREVATFTMPVVPDSADTVALKAARAILQQFHASFAAWSPGNGSDAPRVDLAGLPPATLKVVDEVLGEGEVAIQVGGGGQYRIQESVFAGVWRVCALDGEGRLAADWLEASPVPAVALHAARAAAQPQLACAEYPAGAMNSPALVAEIGQQIAQRQRGDPTHVINLTLFPLSPEDHGVLERALPVGPVAMISRGFGNCRITSTLARDVWRVQYFNSMNTLILNTLEVVDVPEVALAAAEDLEDSCARLAELIEWMGEES